MKIYPYKPGSASAKALAEALGIKRLKHEGPRLRRAEIIINWGSSHITRNIDICENVFNEPEFVKKASNKLETFKTLQGYVPIPEWTESIVEASKWLAEGFIVVARQKLTGHSGEGIILCHKDQDNELPAAPLYTKYIPKKEEYRIHVFRDEAFFVQRKARKKEVEDDKVNWQIRNHANGFIFAHQDIVIGDEAKEAAIMAVKQLGLDFGAVDIIWSAKRGYTVLEVNCAPGMEEGSTTLAKYKEQFEKFV